ncbi:hypothetical protein J5Y04_16125 [Kitasatospora sp. RG8]|uniref:hypothetical protein n=1 Tax=Kitasatospora sp. RG8 TaxID=2820815 RepID=UPI001ADF5300|nr:hypothetical protein [Kitasatospora sp. RG8]MBP0451058.1 hypothetical protein [Kitasatospora sp. RG8]
MLTKAALRTALPVGALALLLAGCGPDNDPGAEPSGAPAAAKGTFDAPLAWKTPADASATTYGTHETVRLGVTPVSVVKGDAAAVDKLSTGVVQGRVPYYVTVTFSHKGGPEDIGAYVHGVALHSDAEHAYGYLPSWGVDFPPCQEGDGEARRLTPGKSVTTCEIFLLPANAQPVFLAYKGSDEKGDVQAVWKVG